MNLTTFGTQESVVGGYANHLMIVVVLATLTPLLTRFGLGRELKVVEQIIAIFLLFLTIELLIYLLPFIISSFMSVF